MNLSDAATRTVDVLSLGVALGTLAKLLPPIAALFTIIWTSICFYEWLIRKLR